MRPPHCSSQTCHENKLFSVEKEARKIREYFYFHENDDDFIKIHIFIARTNENNNINIFIHTIPSR